MADEQKAPYVIVKHREPQGTIKRSARIVRYWKNRQTGNVVAVTGMQNVVPANYLKVIFTDPTCPGLTFSQPLKTRKNPFGGPDEIGFEEEFEPYGNFSSRA